MERMSVVLKACRGLLCAVALAVLPAHALAQGTSNNTVANSSMVGGSDDARSATTKDMTVATRTYDDNKDFPWGWLGLIGLGGLLGLKRPPSEARREVASLPEDLDAQNVPEDFDALTYLSLNPDVARARFNPREHYARHGRHEGRAYRQ